MCIMRIVRVSVSLSLFVVGCASIVIIFDRGFPFMITCVFLGTIVIDIIFGNHPLILIISMIINWSAVLLAISIIFISCSSWCVLLV
jgi:hypothetical protein